MTARALDELVEPGWAKALEPVADQVTAMGQFLRAELAAGRKYLPAGRTSCARLLFPSTRCEF
ncbi:uracil-DNA glycosylase domain protein [Mycobacterium ulcerans str. Harvey]|uniref:Uracil-DNA glycosylase domain protein n=1 Tax=Mycobacterium ulcerans str. Harvey TaxID=1299332 RepID=A0ABN0R035_MYCUL|nr:uracil-DNA glycosylase domain protein [Mycobacterium ulcerans str. Harvey]